jgi:hypothetical protein
MMYFMYRNYKFLSSSDRYRGSATASECSTAGVPGFTIRGGAADVLLSIIAKQETRP